MYHCIIHCIAGLVSASLCFVLGYFVPFSYANVFLHNILVYY